MKKEIIYKTVVLINQDDLSFIKESAQVIKENEFTLLVKHLKKNVFLLIVKSANQIPYADFNILSYKNLTNLQENLTNNLILLLDDRHELKEIMKLTRNHKIKIIYKENFLNELINLKQNRTKITHPSFFAENWSYFNNELTVECYLKEGLVSKKVVCNNTILEIEEIISDKVYKAEEVFKENEELDYEFITDFNKIISDCQNEELLFENDQSSLENEENYLKEEIENNEEYEEINLKEYLNVHDLNNPSLQKCALENIFIPKNTKAFTNRVIKRNKIFFKNESVILKFRKENLTNFSALFVNLFDVEGKMTIYNLNFNSKTEVKKEEFLLKNDILNFKIKPIITKDKGYKVFLEEDALKNGVLTFIGPLLICDKFKVNDFSCSLLDYSYRLIVQEKVKEGYPIKIYKKTVIIKGMFSSPAEVKAYKEYKLRTVNGSEGLIKNSLGGKGIFKAYFFKPVQSGEKRYFSVFPPTFLILIKI